MKPQLLVIRGTQGSGKTTLARRLADELGWPVVHREAFRNDVARKLGIDSLPPAGEAAMDAVRAFYATIGTHLEGGRSTIADSTFPSGVCEPDLMSLEQQCDIGVLHCVVPRLLAITRCHVRPDNAILLAVLAARDEPGWRRVEDPLQSSVPQRRIDTSGAYTPSIETIVIWIAGRFDRTVPTTRPDA